MKADDLILVVPVKAEMLWISFPVGRHHLANFLLPAHTRFIGSLNLSNWFVLLRFDDTDQTEQECTSPIILNDSLLFWSPCYTLNRFLHDKLFGIELVECIV